MTSPRNGKYFQAKLAVLAADKLLKREALTEMRREMDAACDKGELSFKEWRSLLDAVATVQGQLRKI